MNSHSKKYISTECSFSQNFISYFCLPAYTHRWQSPPDSEPPIRSKCTETINRIGKNSVAMDRIWSINFWFSQHTLNVVGMGCGELGQSPPHANTRPYDLCRL